MPRSACGPQRERQSHLTVASQSEPCGSEGQACMPTRKISEAPPKCELANELSTPPSALLAKNLEAVGTDLCGRSGKRMHPGHIQETPVKDLGYICRVGNLKAAVSPLI